MDTPLAILQRELFRLNTLRESALTLTLGGLEKLKMTEQQRTKIITDLSHSIKEFEGAIKRLGE